MPWPSSSFHSQELVFFFAKEDESLLLYWSDPRGIYLNYKTWRVRRLGLQIQDDYEVLVYL
jgi:hypothetical protein